jgi:DNA-binding XRE family transcriptional regulator
VDGNEFSRIRHHLGKTQNEMAQLLGTSSKAVQSFEQGWRSIPMHSERQLLLLLALKDRGCTGSPCWVIMACPPDVRQGCPAWEFKAGRLCWFINGTICKGQVQKNWHEKLEICQKCPAYQASFLSKGAEAAESKAANGPSSQGGVLDAK